MASTLDLYRRISRWPLGHWLFTRAVCLRAPYFSSIRPRIELLEPGRCVVTFKQRRAVQNHIGTVHAIALCNAVELAAGLVTEASLPPSMRWIPKGMDVEYVAIARGRMTATARPEIAAAESDEAYELPVRVEIVDASGTAVMRARVRMWASPRPARKGDAPAA